MRAATFRNEICPDGAGQSGKREMDSSREKKGCHVQTTKPHALLDKSLTCVALEIITNKNLENLKKNGVEQGVRTGMTWQEEKASKP